MKLSLSALTVEGKWLLAIAIVCLAAAAGLLIFGSNRGIDLTDETFYIIWTNDPATYELFYQPFGYVLNPVYELLGRSLPAIRMTGILALMAGGALLGFFCDRFYRLAYSGKYRDDGPLALLGALAALSYYVHWLATPSYNLLGVLGAFIAGAGLVGWMTPLPDGGRRMDRLASLLVGVGGYLSFFGKPPLAAVELALAASIAASQFRKIPLSHTGERIVISGATTLLLVVATIMRVSDPLEFIPTVLETQRIVNLDISLHRLPLKFLREIYSGPPVFLISLLAFLIGLALPQIKTQDARRLRALFLLLLAANLLFFSYRAVFAIRAGFFPPFAALAIVSMMLVWIGFSQLRRRLPAGALAVPIALAFAPFAVAVGTLNDTLGQLNMYVGPALLAVCIVARLTMGPRPGAWLQTMVAGLVVVIVISAALKPHEYPSSIFRQTEPLRIPLAEEPILVDPITKRYASDLQRIGRLNGLRPDSPIVNLTAGGPGTAVLLGGKAPVLAWITHITPHWADVVWDRMSPEAQRQAWIVGPIHPVFAETRVARHLVRNARQYRCVGLTEMKMWGRMRLVAVWKPTAPSEPVSTSCPADIRLDRDMYRRDNRL